MALKLKKQMTGRTIFFLDKGSFALEENKTIECDVVVRVDSISTIKENTYINVSFNINDYSESKTYSLEINNTENVATTRQAYEYLKTLEEFKDAEDC